MQQTSDSDSTIILYDSTNFQIILNEYYMLLLFRFHLPVNKNDQYDVEYKLNLNNRSKLLDLYEFLSDKSHYFILDNMVMERSYYNTIMVSVGIYRIQVRFDDTAKAIVAKFL